MLNRFFAAGAALGLIVGFAGNAKADGFYINPEFNSGWTEATFDGSILEGHVGYEKGSFYIQGGPAVTSDGTDGDWGFTAKTGVSAAVAEKTDIYGEVSIGSFDDVSYAIKAGLKHKL